MKCPNCSHDNQADARFCQNCGRPLERTCSNCGTSNAADARFCKQCGAALEIAVDRLGALRQSAPPTLQDKLRLASANVEGERKPVTILFTDIVGSTALAEKLDPEEWKEIVSGASACQNAVYRYEGTIAQLLATACWFSWCTDHMKTIRSAVRAALGIGSDQHARELQGYVDDFQVRVGINTGMVVLGKWVVTTYTPGDRRRGEFGAPAIRRAAGSRAHLRRDRTNGEGSLRTGSPGRDHRQGQNRADQDF
jgi:hypothetical protein